VTYTLTGTGAHAGHSAKFTKGGCADFVSCAAAKTGAEGETEAGTTFGAWGCGVTEGDNSNAASVTAFEASPVAAAAAAAAAEESPDAEFSGANGVAHVSFFAAVLALAATFTQL